MDSTDVLVLQRRARTRYELARLRAATLGMLPLALVVALALCFTARPASTLGFGLAAAAVGVVLLWYGRDPQRAVLPGTAAGLVPLALSLCANQIHHCGSDGCSSLCAPACTLGGMVAGLAVGVAAGKRAAGIWFWLPASGMALLTGSMGCTCVGYSGVLGLAFGFALGLVPGLLHRPAAEKSP
ncbi:MAG TPA: hypothetical protein VJU61_10535 [Polyangiaceae bacterium]|nr:hypothetical protein [Polyangiaceae bacterium]